MRFSVVGVRLSASVLVGAVAVSGADPRAGRVSGREEGVVVVDHGLNPKKYPVYLGKERGWQDLYNQDDRGAYYLEREFGFRSTRLNLRITQAYIGNEAEPTGRLGLRFPKGSRNVTPTQPLWCSTWCRYAEKFHGMLDVVIGGRGLTGVAPTFDYGTAGAVGFVRARWEHEEGLIGATFLMLPDDDRFFCEVSVETAARGPVAISLCCWPFGNFVYWTGAGRSVLLRYGREYALPPDENTVLFTDPQFDTVGKECQGTCALTYLPNECRSVSVKRTFPLFVTLNLPEAGAGQTVYAHFVLWELLHRRGEDAFAYVKRREDDTLALWDCLPLITDPKLADAREAGLREVRERMTGFDGELSAVRSGRGEGSAVGGLSGRVLGLRWGQFYRREAERHVGSCHWRNALECLRLSGELLLRE